MDFTWQDLGERIIQLRWDELKPCWERGELLLVSQELNLIEVAMALCFDHVDIVGDLLRAGKLYKPLRDEVSYFAETQTFRGIDLPSYTVAQLQKELQ